MPDTGLIPEYRIIQRAKVFVGQKTFSFLLLKKLSKFLTPFRRAYHKQDIIGLKFCLSSQIID